MYFITISHYLVILSFFKTRSRYVDSTDMERLPSWPLIHRGAVVSAS